MAFNKDIASLRQDYSMASLTEDNAGEDPVLFFGKWFAEAQSAAIDEVNAMSLATVDHHGRPHARIVLLKSFDEEGFLFFTNYHSNKGKQLAAVPYASLVFFWKELQRQVRIEGVVERISPQESEAYFSSRPRGSRIGALASPQSEVIESRSKLENVADLLEQKYHGKEIPMPEGWGGFRIKPFSFEYWQGRSSRLHDRILFEQVEDGLWKRCRLAP